MKTLAVATIGQFNPPVREHLKALEKVVNTAKEMDGDPILFITHTQNETNPLPWELKCQYVKSIVGLQINICDDPAVETLADFLAWIGEHQYKDLVLLVGSDKLETVSSFVQRYNDQPTSEGRYGFSSVKIASIGSKDPDNLSMLARNAAIDGDFDAFKRSVAVNSEKLASDMFNTLRKFSGLGENVINTTRLSINKRELTKFFGDLDEDTVWGVLGEEHQTGEQKSLFDPDVYPPKKNAVSLKPTTAAEAIEREQIDEAANRTVKAISFQFPSELVGFSDIHSSSQYSHVLTSFGRGVIGPNGEIKIGPAGSSHRDLSKNLGDTKRFYWGYSRENEIVYVVSKNAMDTDILKNKKILQVILSNVFDFMKLSIAPGGLRIREDFLGKHRTLPATHPSIPLSSFTLYRNPTREEWEEIGPHQRGWITPSGDVYFAVPEGREIAIHCQILQYLLVKSGVSEGSAMNLAWKKEFSLSSDYIAKYGLAIESSHGNRVGLSESYMELELGRRGVISAKRERVQALFRLAKKNVPYLNFIVRSIALL